MASRLKIWGACRTLALRPQPVRLAAQPFRARFYADDATNKPSDSRSGAVSQPETRSANAVQSPSSELASKEVGCCSL